MALLRACVLGALSASVMAAAAMLLQPSGEGPPPVQPGTATVAATAAVLPRPSEGSCQRTLAASVSGTVLDPGGNPVAGIRVAMTGTDDIVGSSADGTFTFCTVERGTCRVLPSPGWLAIESPLLDFFGSDHAPTLLVVRSGRPQGRVCDPDGAPIANARVAVALHASLPRPSRWSKARSVRLRGDWSCETDADGWYCLPPCPVGDRVQLLVEHEGFAAACVDLSDSPALLHVTLQPAAATTDTLSDSQPVVPDTGSCIDGWLLDEAEQPRSGWWAAAVADDAAGVGAGPWGRFVQPPVRVGADGSFAFHELPAGSYRVEAWQPQNRAVIRSQRIAAPESGLRLCLEHAVLPARIRGRVLDASGMPIRDAKAGLARPSGWAVPGHLGMHVQSIVATDRDGNFEIATNGLAALELILAGECLVPRRINLDGCVGERRLELRATERQWLVMGSSVTSFSPTAATTLTALDARDRALPMWLGDSPLVQASCALSASTACAFPADSHSLVLRRGDREVARLYLGP